MKAALIIGLSIIIAAVVVMYLSPYQTCVRGMKASISERVARGETPPKVNPPVQCLILMNRE